MQRAVTVSVLVALAALSTGGRVQAQANASSHVAQRQEEAFERGGLSAAAAVTGRYVRFVRPDLSRRDASLRQLVLDGGGAVAGQVIDNTSYPSADGRTVYTAYRVRLDTTGRLGVSRRDPVTVFVEGGRVRVGAHMAQVIPLQVIRPANGKAYAWLLRPAPSGLVANQWSRFSQGDTFVPVGGALGIFSLDEPDRRVRSSARYRAAAIDELKRGAFTSDGFLQHLKELSRGR